MSTATIAARVAGLQAELAAELAACGRATASARVCAVSKRQPRSALDEAVAAGIHDIGESYVQEAVPKIIDLRGVTKHFIGHIQTNKAKLIVANFDVIHSVDRLDAGLAIAKAIQATGRGVRVLIQVNISPTERYGLAPQDAVHVAQTLRQADVSVDGIMAIGPLEHDPATIRRSFEEAASCFAEVGGSMFSIGMSGDWREAIACGSTLVRIGTAIFGARSNPPGHDLTAI